MEKNITGIPIKIRSSKEYVFHFIGTMNTFRYDVQANEFQAILGGSIIKRFYILMTYEDFEFECKRMFLKVIQTSFGWN